MRWRSKKDQRPQTRRIVVVIDWFGSAASDDTSLVSRLVTLLARRIVTTLGDLPTACRTAQDG
jgi:hypothetical protein